jgi:hypothetical protein
VLARSDIGFVENLDEHRRRLSSDIAHGLRYGGQRRLAEAREADVVEANDRDIFRHSQPTSFDGAQGAYGHLVIRAEDGRERHAAGKQGARATDA